METLLKKLEDSNESKSKKILEKISENINTGTAKHATLLICLTFNFFTTTLPIITRYPEEFRLMIERALFDNDMKGDLERNNIINWCRTSQLFYPLETKRDGNCLLHAISLCIYGIHDSSLMLRRFLYTTLVTDKHHLFKNRYQHYLKDRNSVYYELESLEVAREWTNIVEDAKPDTRFNNHKFLEPIHIFVMSNILQRPIIVLADDRARTLGTNVSIQENDIGGIYLPLEIPAQDCIKNPIVIGFSFCHFCPLVTSKEDPDTTRKAIIPLQKKDLSMLPIKFLYPQEEKQILNLTGDYLCLQDLVHSENGTRIPISGAVLGTTSLPDDLNLIPDYFQDCERKYRRHLDSEGESQMARPTQPTRNSVQVQNFNNDQILPNQSAQEAQNNDSMVFFFQPVKCFTAGCEMFGNAASGNMCSTCLNKHTEQNAGPPSNIKPIQPILNIEPTAPMASIPLQVSTEPRDAMYEMSIMENEKCQVPTCTYYCSNKTFPYCHECYEKFNNVTTNAAMRESQNQIVQESFSAASNNHKYSQQTPNNIAPGSAMRESGNLNQNQIVGELASNSHRSVQPTSNKENLIVKQTQRRPDNRYISENHKKIQLNEETRVQHVNPYDQYIPPNNLSRESDAELFGNGGLNFSREADEVLGRPLSFNSLSPGLRTFSPDLRPVASQSPQLSCQAVGCSSSAEIGNLCKLCYITGRQSQTQPSDSNSATMSNSLPQPTTISGQSPTSTPHSIPKPKAKYLCPKPGCSGIRQENHLGLCMFCFEKSGAQKATSSPNISFTETGFQDYGNIEENVTESRTPTNAMVVEVMQVSCVDDDDSVNCASPMCNSLVHPPNKLCHSCLDVLRHNQPPHIEMKSTSGLCKNKGCTFHGSSQFNGYCSSCHKNIQAGRRNVLVNNSAPQVPRRNMYPVETPAPRAKTAPIIRRGRLCTNEGCTRFGDPATSNLCSRCYDLSQPAQALSAQIPSHNGAAGLENNFLRSAHYLEEQGKGGRLLCRKDGCQNFGNQSTEGFCNSCYEKYYKRSFPPNLKDLERIG